jgi:Mrp family chromosome partitioning ATPase
LNLALSIAREGNNSVFLIDLDMRNPRMCSYLGVAPPLNIDSYLAGEGNPEDVLFSIGVEHLTLAGTANRTNEASELLAAGRLEKLFAYIRDVAPQPIVLMDLPPLLSTDDALVVAPKIDACLLVLSEGYSRRDSAAKALELLADFTMAGVVLNRSRAVVKDYHSSYY